MIRSNPSTTAPIASTQAAGEVLVPTPTSRFEWHTELGCRLHLQPRDVDQHQPRALPNGLGSEGDGEGCCRRTTARHHLTPHQHGLGPTEQ